MFQQKKDSQSKKVNSCDHSNPKSHNIPPLKMCIGFQDHRIPYHQVSNHLLVVSYYDSKFEFNNSFNSRFDIIARMWNLFINIPQVRTQCGINASFQGVNCTTNLRVEINFPSYNKLSIRVMLNRVNWVIGFQVDYTRLIYNRR